jgi:hypothetical protein
MKNDMIIAYATKDGMMTLKSAASLTAIQRQCLV